MYRDYFDLDSIAAMTSAMEVAMKSRWRAGGAPIYTSELVDFVSHIIVTTETSARHSTAVQQESVRTAGRWNFQRSATPRGSHVNFLQSAAAAARCRWTRGATAPSTAPAARALY